MSILKQNNQRIRTYLTGDDIKRYLSKFGEIAHEVAEAQRNLWQKDPEL